MDEIFSSVIESFGAEELVFSVSFVVSTLIMLWALSLVHQKIRVLEGELASLRKDHNLMSEELEVVARLRQGVPPAS